MRLRRLLLFALTAAVLLTGCQVNVAVDIDVEDDGTGTVTVGVGLDEEAAARAPSVSDILRTDDLTATGWTVSGPAVEADGLRWIRATKRFGDAAQLQQVLDEITGPDGAFQDFQLSIEDDFASNRYAVTGTVDLSDGLQTFSDGTLTELLDGRPLGVDLEELEAELGTPPAELVSTTVTVRLPGADDGSPVVVPLGETATVDVSATEEDLMARLWRWIAVAGFVLFGASVIFAGVGWWADRRALARAPRVRTPESVRSRVPAPAASRGPARTGPRAGPRPSGPPDADDAGPRRVRLRQVVIELHGVLFGVSDPAAEVLAPFVRERGGTTDLELVRAAWQEVTLGRLDTAEVWQRLGVVGDADELDTAYAGRYSLRSDAKEFLREMRRRKMPVAVVCTDAPEWARHLREQHGLGGLDPWVVSGTEGVALPELGLFEALRRSTGVAYDHCLLISGRLADLDLARSLGMTTALFVDRRPDDAVAHPVVTNFSGFFRKRSSTAAAS